MSRELTLSEEDLITLQKCLNEGIEPPQELAKKIFPSLYASYDFKTLKDSKIPTIEYQGKRPEAVILNEASAFGGGSPLQLERSFDGGKINRSATQLDLFNESRRDDDANWQNLIVQGDNLQFLKTCYLNQDPIIKDKVKGKVKLVYIDPPFATKSDFASKEGEDSYSDKIDRAEFVEALRERLIFIREILMEGGTIYVHLDHRMNHYLKVLLDEVFGKEAFLNNVVWKRQTSSGFKGKNVMGKNHDDLLVYYRKGDDFQYNTQYIPYSEEYIKQRFVHVEEETGRRFKDAFLGTATTNETIERLKNENRIYYTKEGGMRLKVYLDEAPGIPLDDVWTDINFINSMAEERLNFDFPTQKPEILLERIILASSNPGDLVMDVFAGSGTTAAVAEKLGRRWIACDFGKQAIYITQKRMCQIADSQKLNTDSKKKGKYGKPPKPFCVVSVGAFDFGKIMNLRQNRDAYIRFVMGIFGLTERDDDLARKYKISNVCAFKEGNPVEVYPIWEDEFLKNIRVDEDYLKGILDQSGGKLKGDYYIIAPETCVRVGETEMRNIRGDRLTFKMLTFPYKVLEEAARHFSIEEQPSSPENINKLISSVGFYFNEEVRVEVRKTTSGFTIAKFETSILDRDERLYEGLEGLAMILVDSGYDEERGFTVDQVVYQKDLKGEEAVVAGITSKTAVIAIDKHGNESEITALK